MQNITPEALRRARESHTVALTTFMTLFGRRPLELFCFIEGIDDRKYYEPRINTYFPSTRYHLLPCKGKAGVLKVYELIQNKAEYADARTMYFVDRDFDVSTENPDVFETPCYSIENLYCTQGVFSRILKTEFGIGEGSIDFDRCMDAFKHRQEDFHRAVFLINGWIACNRDMYKEQRASRLNLSNFSIKDFVTIRLDDVQADYGVLDLRSKFDEAPPVPLRVLSRKIKELRSTDPQKSFRGKFEIEFLRTIFQKLKDAAVSAKNGYFSAKHNVPLTLSKSNILSELSQYAETPKDLAEYLLWKQSQYGETQDREKITTA